MPPDLADEVRYQLLQTCELEGRPTTNDAIAANQVVVNYIKGIGRLEGADLVNMTPSMNNVQKSLTNLGQLKYLPISQETINQGIKIVTSILNWAAERYQGQQLSKAIICSDAPLGKYLGGLSEAYQDYYIKGQLNSEEKSIRLYYNALALSQAELSRKGKQFLTVKNVEALNSNSCDAVMPIRRNRYRVQGYLNILALTAKTNKDIADEFKKAGYNYSPAECSAYLQPSTRQAPAEQASGNSSLMTEKVTPAGLPLESRLKLYKTIQSYQASVRAELAKMQ